MPLASILLPNLAAGGAERIKIELAREFVTQGCDVEFTLMKAEGELLDEARAEFPVIDLGAPRARQVPLALARYLRERRPDALLVAMWPLTVIAPLARLISGHRCRVVVSEHSILSLHYSGWGLFHRLTLRATMALGYRMADAAVGVSNGVVQDMARLSFVPAGRFSVIHNPLRTLRTQKSEHGEVGTFWPAEAGLRIVSVGKLKPEKNHALLIRAFGMLVRKRACSLMIVGSGDLEPRLRALAAELCIADRVVFAGFQPDPTPFYESADLFVLSSDYEGFGNVIVEALACGTPVVSTDCPSGPAEILENGRYGRLVPVGDADALAAAMAETLDAEHDREALKRRAADFSPDIAARKYLDLLFPAGTPGARPSGETGSA